MASRRTGRASCAPSDGEVLRELFDAAFESLDSALVLFDSALNPVFRNQAAKALLPDQADLSKMLSSLTVESGYEDWNSELRRVIKTGIPRRLDALVPSHNEKPEQVLGIVINRLRDPSSGEPMGGVLLAEDVTARTTMERRLAVSERLAAVGKLAARVAHELNNPLDGILRYTNLALRLGRELQKPTTAADDPAARLIGYLENARTGIIRMTEIITSLLDFSRNAPGSFEQATINKIAEDAVTALEGRARDAGITVVCNFLQTDMPVVRGSNLFQVFCNIIKNAVDAMPDGGTLTITTAVMNDEVVVTFEDTGVGLPDTPERIFEPFFTTKPLGKGTGLGLAVCKELIEKYSGRITAAKRQPRGTTIIVQVPLKSLAATPPAAQRNPRRRKAASQNV